MKMTAIHVLSQYFSIYLHPEIDERPDLRQPDYLQLFRLTAEQWCDFLMSLVSSRKNTGSFFSEILFVNQYQLRELAKIITESLRGFDLSGLSYLLYHDVQFPARLREMPDPPVALSYRGDLGLFSKKMVAIVGSRKASAKALEMSALLGLRLAKEGYVVVSGGAYGCDISAHRGVLNLMRTPAPIIVVMAAGLSQLYPRGNLQTFYHISHARGALVSERLWNAQCRRTDFPIRNRLVSGLASHVIVMEAGEKSGAMITAQMALDQGRDVWVYQGVSKTGDARACGNNRLISDGAPVFECFDELVDNLRETYIH